MDPTRDIQAWLATLERHHTPVLAVLNAQTMQPVAYLIRPEAATVGQVEAANAKPREVRDLPRAQRPKLKLSKRQRDAAKREKMAAGAGA